MRRIPVVLAALAMLVSATPALAVDGCGAGFDLLSVDATVARVDDRIYTAPEWAELSALIAAEDADGDGMLCSKQFEPNRGQDKQWIGPEDGDISDYVITLITDNAAVGRGS
jgi:hypothetical protein